MDRTVLTDLMARIAGAAGVDKINPKSKIGFLKNNLIRFMRENGCGMVKKLFKKRRYISVFIMLSVLVVMTAFFRISSVCAQTLEELKNRQFDQMKEEISEKCRSTSYETLMDGPKEEYLVLEYLLAHRNCSNDQWTPELKRLCFKRWIFLPETLKNEKDLAALEKTLQEVPEDYLKFGVKAFFYQDPSYCSKISLGDRLNYSVCRAISSLEGAEVCLKSFSKEDSMRLPCLGAYYFMEAMKTHDVERCKSIDDYPKRVSCEVLLADSGNAQQELKKNFFAESCLSESMPVLAAVGVLDPNGPEDAEFYCERILDKDGYGQINYQRCQALVRKAKEHVAAEFAERNQTPLVPQK